MIDLNKLARYALKTAINRDKAREERAGLSSGVFVSRSLVWQQGDKRGSRK
ncbi:MAG: hypothetical protein HDR37_12770 [Treponema sp.]|nr:hypothetical protein [Treponema sp.]